MIRIFKIKGFVRFQRKERMSDRSLLEAIRQVEHGLFDADLGNSLVKKRIARLGQGKRSGYRTIIAIRRNDKAVFLFGFAKNERSNIADEELEELKKLASVYLALNEKQIEDLIAYEELVELYDA